MWANLLLFVLSLSLAYSCYRLGCWLIRPGINQYLLQALLGALLFACVLLLSLACCAFADLLAYV